MADILLDTLIDSLKLIPFLFVTYFIMEELEHHSGADMQKKIEKAGKWGPLWGGILGVVPQCGFSAAAASLFAGKAITVGTLVAIFLSTSDEMLPILISESVAADTIGKILLTKVCIAIVSGFIIEALYRGFLKLHERDMDIHEVCEHEHCHCEDGALKSALKHTAKIAFYIFILSLILNVVIELLGQDALASIFTGLPVVGEILASLVGLIPNCASSVVITQLYLDGIIGAGPLMAGLLVNAGVGMLVLFRLNRSVKENLSIIGAVYLLGVIWGVLIELLGIVF